MRKSSLLAAAMFVLSSVPLPSLAQSGSGTLWEIGMEMEGMPAGMASMMPKQRVCMSNDPETAPPPDEGCTILEQRSQGNRHFARMQCKEGLMELDQTRTKTTMTQKTSLETTPTLSVASDFQHGTECSLSETDATCVVCESLKRWLQSDGTQHTTHLFADQWNAVLWEVLH